MVLYSFLVLLTAVVELFIAGYVFSVNPKGVQNRAVGGLLSVSGVLGSLMGRHGIAERCVAALVLV